MSGGGSDFPELSKDSELIRLLVSDERRFMTQSGVMRQANETDAGLAGRKEAGAV